MRREEDIVSENPPTQNKNEKTKNKISTEQKKDPLGVPTIRDNWLNCRRNRLPLPVRGPQVGGGGSGRHAGRDSSTASSTACLQWLLGE